MSLSPAVVVSHDAPEVMQAEKMMEPATAPVPPGAGPGQHSAPSSPCVTRKIPQTLSLDASKIPQPLASPTPLRRSGSLRLRGEKQGFGHLRLPSGRGHGPGTRASPGTTFPSITEAAESWKKSLRGSGDGPSLGLPLHNNSNLHQQRHHRSLQSLSSRPTSRDSFPHTPTPSPEDIDLLRPQNLNRFLLDHAREFSSDQDDLDSLRSYGSNCSTQSACDHAQFGRNGTTFSGRRMKYIVHCSSHPEPNEYLTPTQRANQQIRRLKALVEQAHKDIEMKDESIFKLTKEVVELKLLREEVDGSPSKSSRNPEDSPVCRVTTHLENECGNSTSLSDSGHFDDVLSVTSPQSNHSPGPRQLALTPESERQAEIYQRKIDDVNRKHGEKSVEDRKSLVDMYEKKMEEMSRKASENLKLEKNELIEMYEKRIEDIVRRHQDKLKEERTLAQDSFNKKMEDANTRFSDLQQELFQCRENAVLIEEDVENLRKKILTQEHQLSEKQIALVQTAQLESELQVLRRHMEGQQEFSEQTSQLHGELAEVVSQLKEMEIRYKKLECEKNETEAKFEAMLQEAHEQKSHLEGERSTMLQGLQEMEKKIELLEQEKSSCIEDLQKLAEVKCKAEKEFIEVSKELKYYEETKTKLESEKTKLEDLYKEEKKTVQHLKLQLESKSDQLQHFISEESQKKRDLEDQTAEIIVMKEEECRHATDLMSKLERELTSVRESLSEQLQNKIELENWKLNAQEEIKNHLQIIQDLSENSEYLKREIIELKTSLDERCKSQEMQDGIIDDLTEKLNNSVAQLNKKQNDVQQLTDCIANHVKKLKTVSELLEIEKNKNSELLPWKTVAEKMETDITWLKQNLDEKIQQLHYFSDIESEMSELKKSLLLKEKEVEELIMWKSKALNLEEELKSMEDGMATSMHKMHLVNAISEDIQSEATSELPSQLLPQQNQLNLKNSVIPCVPYEAQQHVLELEAEIQKLRESLDQSYWSQSEKEMLNLGMEKTVADQNLKLQRLENEVVMLNQCIARLQEEKDNPMTHIDQHLLNANPPENKISLNLDQEELEILPGVLGQNDVQDDSLHNINGTENAELIVSELKSEIESLRKALADQEERHTEMNLKMYLKGQEAAKFERKDQLLEMAVQSPEKVSIPELVSQLAETEKELEKVKAMYRQLAEGQANNSSSPEATLLFLKSAVYYFLTDEANCQGHLHAIQSILGFTEAEKQSIDMLTYIRR